MIQTIEAKPWKTCMTPPTASAVTAMMVRERRARHRDRAQIDSVAVAGKTGTAQTGVEGQAPHAWFVAFAPADNPRYAVSVLVENGGNYGNEATGGEVAAPIARQMLARHCSAQP